MGVTWWLIVIVACLGLAAAIVVAMRPTHPDPSAWRPLANVARLTGLPAYVRAARRRTVRTVATLGLLAVAFGAAALVAARPTGLPSAGYDVRGGQPEDVMVCAGAPPDDPAVAAALRYFAGHATTLDTQRIGLTSTNRRVIPLTRDHQFASERFAAFAGQPIGGDFAPPVRYVDYAASVDDVLALCLTGFPDFESVGAQRRSLVYVGPADFGSAAEGRASLFEGDGVRAMAAAAGVQVNVLLTGRGGEALEGLARDTGGAAFSAQSDVAARLDEIRDRPPPTTDATADAVRSSVPDTPDLPLLVAVLAIVACSLVPVAVRR